MRLNTSDLTLQRNYLEKYRFLIKEYESVKAKRHPQFKKAKDFYLHHNTCAQSFLKYYNRYKQSGRQDDLLPSKRGPRYKTRRPLPFIEEKVKLLREKGNNRYEIHSILKPILKTHTPSPSGVYNICKRYHLNRLNQTMKQEKRRIIKQKVGELGHIDCHHLSRSVIKGKDTRLYLVCVVDDHSRVAWAELVDDVKSLTVMFATLKCLNMVADVYQIKYQEVMTDNGPEFGRPHLKDKSQHPFERMLMELGIKHRYTRPYRPQTNGKVERFWITIQEDLLNDTHFDSVTELKEELIQYLHYYNHLRPHQGIMGQVPTELLTTKPSTN
jgi:hypothetical protein